MMNSLSQVLIKLTSPGVPDVYQGNELFEFRLVDPDNRQPVDYSVRKKLLCEFTKLKCCEFQALAQSLAEKVQRGEDREGRAKLFVTWRTLKARQDRYAIFRAGDYIPLSVEGSASKHLIAFARREGNSCAIVAVPRLIAQLMGNRTGLSDLDIWKDTRLKLPPELNDAQYLNWMTGEKSTPSKDSNGDSFIDIASAMKNFPWLLLINEAKFAS